MKVSLCIPAYNEEKIIKDTVKTLDDYMKANFDDYEILISNDGSTDNTASAASELSLPNVRVVGYDKNRGKGCAVRTAILESTGDVAIFTDCDLAYGTDVIKTMADMFEDNPDADMVIGSRNIVGNLGLEILEETVFSVGSYSHNQRVLLCVRKKKIEIHR